MIVEKFCSACGSLFMAKPAEFYCSTACKTKAANVAASSFPRYFRRLLRLKAPRRESLTVEFLLNLLERQEGKCAISGEKMTCEAGGGVINTNASIDRIDPRGVYEPGNVQLVCRIINVMKTDLPLDEFKSWCSLVADR